MKAGYWPQLDRTGLDSFLVDSLSCAPGITGGVAH